MPVEPVPIARTRDPVSNPNCLIAAEVRGINHEFDVCDRAGVVDAHGYCLIDTVEFLARMRSNVRSIAAVLLVNHGKWP